MRTVHVRATWVSHHMIEVPDDHPKIDHIDDLLAIEDIYSNVADLRDWDINDPGPSDRSL